MYSSVKVHWCAQRSSRIAAKITSEAEYLAIDDLSYWQLRQHSSVARKFEVMLWKLILNLTDVNSLIICDTKTFLEIIIKVALFWNSLVIGCNLDRPFYSYQCSLIIFNCSPVKRLDHAQKQPQSVFTYSALVMQTRGVSDNQFLFPVLEFQCCVSSSVACRRRSDSGNNVRCLMD